MIDFHTHLLPELDDGSQSVPMTFSMLDMMKEQGIRRIVATPHFYANNYTVEQFLEKRLESYQKVVVQAKQTDRELPKIRLGAEVYYFSGIGRANLLNRLCIEDTDVLLLELPFCQWENRIYDELSEIIHEQKLQIVLAHIERYYSLQKDRTVWEAIMRLPLYKQMNAGPFLYWKSRRKAMHILQEQKVVLLGSDCHNDMKRKPNLLDGLSVVVGKMGDGYLKELSALEEKLMGTW